LTLVYASQIEMAENHPGRVRPSNFAAASSTAEKTELVLRLLAGEPIRAVAQESQRPRRQLAAWKRRFLEGGEAALAGPKEAPELDLLRVARQKEEEKVEELEVTNRLLERRIRLLSQTSSADHPTCSAAYAHALEDADAKALAVPEWGTYVLVRASDNGLLQATGMRPLAGLGPTSDVKGGLERLRRAGVRSISLVTNPLWCPELSVLQRHFDSCRKFKSYFLVDRGSGRVRVRKRHRNRINHALRKSEVREVSLADHLDTWLRLYRGNARRRQIGEGFSPTYFERLVGVDGLETLAVVSEGRIVTMTLWLRHEEVLYFHDGASAEEGFQISASYAAFGHAIERSTSSSYVFLGGSAGLRDDPRDGLASFRRGFANATAPSYVCSATLHRSGNDEVGDRPGQGLNRST
jgi:transposase-like protein